MFLCCTISMSYHYLILFNIIAEQRADEIAVAGLLPRSQGSTQGYGGKAVCVWGDSGDGGGGGGG